MIIRPFVAIASSLLILGFVYQYTQFTQRIRPQPLEFSERRATGTFDIRVVCTFDAQGNEFDRPGLSIKYRDEILLQRKSVAAGEVVQINDVAHVSQGDNQFFVSVTPRETGTMASDGAFSLDSPIGSVQDKQGTTARAVRIEIRRDQNIIADKVIWSNTPGPIGELVRIEVPALPKQEEH